MHRKINGGVAEIEKSKLTKLARIAGHSTIPDAGNAPFLKLARI